MSFYNYHIIHPVPTKYIGEALLIRAHDHLVKIEEAWSI